MHTKVTNLQVLCLASSDFINSLNELKENFNFNIFFSETISIEILNLNYDALVIKGDQLNKSQVDIINLVKNKPKVLIYNSKKNKHLKYDEEISLPIRLDIFNKKVFQLITSLKYAHNSSLHIKDYILDKNEKKLKKNNLFIDVTEKEVELLELLENEKKPLKKKIILEKVWQYASDADTHTVETHIYRLRKKFLDTFNDEKFILNNKDGYFI
ncbi:helix-turn-helix domain-containing protein [Pelagibacteraceae bacterium]|jgi:hypothetical protein|nr:helix-turn-helix domain-containing protein [Pelagibacteraceae bacterium]|tara:strand:+ start:10595 stop:11233 length:639 start_codon:yes stop_codon:yes gene_type:complete